MHGFDLKSGSFVALTFRPASADLKGGGVPEKTERQGHSRQGGPAFGQTGPYPEPSGVHPKEDHCAGMPWGWIIWLVRSQEENSGLTFH